MPRPPEEIALMELEAAAGLMDFDPRLYTFRLTGILKAYLGRRYRFRAPEMTTQEISGHLKLLSMDRGRASDLREFLSAADTVKYAGLSIDRKALETDAVFVRSFVLADSGASAQAPDSPDRRR
jgi:hypothetical protein